MAANSKFAVATHILVGLAYFTKNPPKSGGERASELVSSEYLASSVNTNPVVVRRILADLGRSGLVRSQAGKHGGVALARPASEIRLVDVYEAVGEEPVFAFNPAGENPRCPVSRSMHTALEPVFERSRKALKESLGDTKLSEIVKKVR